jgi:hypothetical protein
MKNTVAILIMTAAAFLSLTACGRRPYYAGPPPAPGAYWVPGHWQAGPYGQHWVSGHWR